MTYAADDYGYIARRAKEITEDVFVARRIKAVFFIPRELGEDRATFEKRRRQTIICGLADWEAAFSAKDTWTAGRA